MVEINPYDSSKPHLYIAERAKPKDLNNKYVYYHERDKDGGGTFPHNCVSLEYLSGYIDGATTNRMDDLMLNNGIPEKHSKLFRFRTQPIAKNRIKELANMSAQINTFYSYLLEKE